MRTLAELFGVASAKEVMTLTDPPAQGAVRRDPGYVFRADLVRDLAMFWLLPGERSAMLVGEKGAGKTTGVEQWHAALNWPLYMMTGHKKLRPDDLFGQYLPNDCGGLDWHDGPVTRAARIGASVLINEINAADPGVTIALNDIAQMGSRITIAQTGEIIEPAATFRIFATMNPPGRGGVNYHGRQPLDASTRERFMWVQVEYPSRDDEIAIVQRAFASVGAVSPTATRPWAERMVDVAAEVRASAIGSSDASDAIPETLSTRVLVRWARYWVALMNRTDAVHLALRRALTTGSDPDAAAAIHALVSAKFPTSPIHRAGP